MLSTEIACSDILQCSEVLSTIGPTAGKLGRDHMGYQETHWQPSLSGKQYYHCLDNRDLAPQFGISNTPPINEGCICHVRLDLISLQSKD